jgi:hypothetical protein
MNYTKEFLDKVFELTPHKVMEKWGVSYPNPYTVLLSGGIRTHKEKIIAFYVYVNTKITPNSILRFNIEKGEMVFDSIYIHDGPLIPEYRYDSEGKEIARYIHEFDVSNNSFAYQIKPGKEKKEYFNEEKYGEAGEEVLDFIKENLYYNPEELERLSYFMTSESNDEKYWGLRR